jgi:hypothetical protein
MSEPPKRKPYFRQLKVGNLDRRQAEALALELRQLAREHNLDFDTLRITLDGRDEDSSDQPLV